MSINAFQITPSGNILVQTQANTLDEFTRELPQGLYTTFSTLSHGVRVLGFHAHLARLYMPAAELSISPAVDAATLRNRIAALTKINLPGESRVRLILIKDNGNIFICAQPFEPLPKTVYEDGVKVITVEMARQTPRLKDTGFISASIEQRRQVGKDAFEVLLTKGGCVLEGMTSNFYAVNGSKLTTARRGILFGVTRRVILRLARGMGMSIEYRAPALNEKMTEAFLTSSSRGVVPIVSIDHQPVGRGRVGRWAKMLLKAYQEYVEERSEQIVE
ncbi:MAG: aminotransferase class IV family protein [Chloroflexi bacterium]|nr:aminotransferase class IV family protein [Chloroflexota bacterium]